MPSDPIHEYLAASKKATLQMAGGAEMLGAAVHERWSVKTAADAGAQQLVGQAPTVTTIANLVTLPVPAVRPPDARTPGAEETVWQLDATLTGYKQEADGDYHLVITDDQGHTMIAEIPDPAQLAPGSFFAQQIAAARQAFDTQLGAPPAPVMAAPATAAAAEVVGGVAAAAAALSTLVAASEPVTLQGLGFFDFAHGQDGVAPNAIELHPVISIVFRGQAPAAAPLGPA